MDKVTVGRTVHYVVKAGESLVHQAAIVTVAGENGWASLFVMAPYGVRHLEAVYSEEPKEMTWHWPERAE